MPSSLRFSQKFRYSCTSAGLNIVSTTVATWLLYYWSPPPDSGRPQYLNIGLVGLLLGVGRIWDAVIDPVIGHWSDGIQTRWGRRRPFLLFATPVMVLMLVLLWTPPASESGVINGVYFFCVTTGFYTSLSFIGIPYDSSLPEMAKTVPERVSLSMWKNILGTMGVLVGVAIAPFLLTRTNAMIMGLAVGSIAWICIYITVSTLQETPLQQPQDLKLPESLLSLLQNKPFPLLGLSTIIVQTAYAMLLTNLPYFVTLIIGRSESQVSWFQGIVVITMILTAPIWNWLVRYYSQRQLLMVTMLGLVVMAIVNFSVDLIPGVSPTIMALISLALLAPFLGGYFILVYAMMGDVVDYDEVLTGKRREALYYGIFSLSAGMGVALATFIVPLLFEIYGYTAANPLGVRMVFLVGAGLVFLGAVAFRGYRLGGGEKPYRVR
jgi:GPH family glycoside/pentoside/hexuronide:cation symporter